MNDPCPICIIEYEKDEMITLGCDQKACIECLRMMC